MKKEIVARAALAAWTIIWVLFLVRPFYKKGVLSEYAHLWRLSAEEKRAYVTGEELYAFIGLCKESVSEPSTYKVVGIESDSLDHRRFKYYLYPNIETDNPKYIFTYPKHNMEKSD